jgi:hypothetical protein
VSLFTALKLIGCKSPAIDIGWSLENGFQSAEPQFPESRWVDYTAVAMKSFAQCRSKLSDRVIGLKSTVPLLACGFALFCFVALQSVHGQGSAHHLLI